MGAALSVFKPLVMLWRLVWRLVRQPLGRVYVSFALQVGGDAARRRRQAARQASSMLAEFHRLGFTRRIATGRKRRAKRQRIRFEYPLLMTHDELWCPVDLRRLPTGVRTDDLRDEAVLMSMQDRLNASVRPDYLANGKLCFVVRLNGSTFPEKFGINSFKLPAEAPSLAFPLGVGIDGTHAYCDIGDVKHLIIAGATGGGKTTLQHVIISTLISRNTIDELELWLIDLKGTEFPLYKSLMGRKGQPGMVRHLATEPEAAVEVLDSAYKEIRRRNELMERNSATSIQDLAQLTGQRLKRIVLVFDEISIMTLDTTKIGKQSIGNWGTFLMAKIAALGRSAGVHIIIGTQMIKKEVLSGLIQANFENRICFSTANYQQSQMVVETSEADGLPTGRAIMRKEGRTSEHQTCLISPKQVRLEVARIAEYGPDGGLGDNEELVRFVKDAKLLLSAACEHFQGDFARAKLIALDGVRGIIPQERFNEVAQRLERDGVLEVGGPRRPRRVTRAFFGRAGLLDSFYGLQEGVTAANRGPTVSLPDAEQLEEMGIRLEQQDALEPALDESPDTVYGLDSPATCMLAEEEPPAPAEESSDPPLSESVDSFLRSLDDPSNKRKRGRKKD